MNAVSPPLMVTVANAVSPTGVTAVNAVPPVTVTVVNAVSPLGVAVLNGPTNYGMTLAPDDPPRRSCPCHRTTRAVAVFHIGACT